MKPILLASTSPFRRELLARLGVPFEVAAPAYEEGPVPGLGPAALAVHHALGKARSVADRRAGWVVVGSDQVADLDGRILGKPGTEANAITQLLAASGRVVVFHTGLAVVAGGGEHTRCVRVEAHLRRLSRDQVETYVRRDRPLGSAGSFRIEALGIALMERVVGEDFTALVGLPLIALTELLGRIGIDVLGSERDPGQQVR